MLALFIRQGGEYIGKTTVTRVETQGDKITGATDQWGKTYSADRVVFNGDPPHLYDNLLEDRTTNQALILPEKLLKYSMGLYVLYFGADKKYEDVAHHTIWLAERFKPLLKEIFGEGALPDDFSLYVHRPTATDPSFAPPGHESFYVLCPVPNLKGSVDWAKEGPRLQQRILDALDKTLLPGINEHVQSPFYMTPEDFKADYLTKHGTGFSIQPIFRQSASFRFRNQDRRYKNLFLVGAGTHPGAGLPGVVSSAKVMQAIIESEKG